MRRLALVATLLLAGCRTEVKAWHTQRGDVDQPAFTVGEALTTRFNVFLENKALEATAITPRSRPGNLKILADNDVVATVAGDACYDQVKETLADCAEATSYKGGTFIDVVVNKTGTRTITLLSDDTDEKATITLNSEELADVQIRIATPRSPDDSPNLFAGELVDVEPSYRVKDVLGNVEIPGTSELRVVSPPEASALLDGHRFNLADAGVYTLETAVLPTQVTLRAFRTEDIARIGVDGGTAFKPGDQIAWDLTPYSDAGFAISGEPLGDYGVTSTAPVGERFHDAYRTTLVAADAGTGVVTVRWGAGRADIPVVVTP